MIDRGFGIMLTRDEYDDEYDGYVDELDEAEE